MIVPERGPSLDAGRQLILVHRPELAERELRHWLSLHPDDAEGHALLSWALARQKRGGEAVAAGREAVRLAPDWAYPHAVLANVHLELGQARAAERQIREALRLDPHPSSYYAVLSAALLSQPLRFKTRAALRAAEDGLMADAGDPDCARLRAQALGRLFRRREAREAAAYALRVGPDVSATHAAVGWIELAWGDRARSRELLREALRMDPMNADAQRGLRVASQGSRFGAALVVQVEAWTWPLCLVALVFAAELAAVLTRSAPDDALFVIAYSLFILSALEATMLWVRLRRAPLLAELRRPGALSRGERRDARWTLMLALAVLLLIPLLMLVDPPRREPRPRIPPLPREAPKMPAASPTPAR